MSKKQSESQVQVVSEKPKVRPQLTGDLTVGRYNSKRLVGRIAAWVQVENLGTKAPVFQGNVTLGSLNSAGDFVPDAEGKSFFVAWLHGYHLVKDE